MNNIYIGDIVYRIYGIYPMMVEKIQDNLATCVWFNEKNQLTRENFPTKILFKRSDSLKSRFMDKD